MKKVLIIVRGLPNSGKSTFAKLLGKAICTADDWYTRKGIYAWDYRYIGEAHEWCERKCRRFMQKGISPIIITNTNVTERIMRPYVDMAEDFSYITYFIVVENRHGNKNSHGVPEETIVKMKERLINNIKL
jgi:predicted kinase